MSDDLEKRRYAMNERSNDRHTFISGSVLIAVGVWAALAPFTVGDWEWGTYSGNFLLTIVPGAAAAFGGLAMLAGRRRLVSFGGTLALLGGLWFVAAPLVYALFAGPHIAMLQSGEPVHLLRWIVFFLGAGALVSFVSSYSLGLVTPLEFTEDAPQTAGVSRARVPQPAERPRRQRGVSEGAPQPADHPRGKRSARRVS
jgi:hypothetical protein